MSITDSGTPKKEERIANIIVKSFNQKKKKSICVNHCLRKLLFKTLLNNTYPFIYFCGDKIYIYN